PLFFLLLCQREWFL
ncbi:hypothetical protein EC5905_0472, partial [Escherichia coli 5905]